MKWLPSYIQVKLSKGQLLTQCYFLRQSNNTKEWNEKYEQIHMKTCICLHLLKKWCMGNSVFLCDVKALGHIHNPFKYLRWYLLWIYNPGHNILKHFDVWQNFCVTASEIVIISNKHGIYKLPHELPSDIRLRTLGN